MINNLQRADSSSEVRNICFADAIADLECKTADGRAQAADFCTAAVSSLCQSNLLIVVLNSDYCTKLHYSNGYSAKSIRLPKLSVEGSIPFARSKITQIIQ